MPDDELPILDVSDLMLTPVEPEAPAPAEASAAPVEPPLKPEDLPEQFRKHVDPAKPKKLRMMAARALIPMPPSDQVQCLVLLCFDPEPSVAEKARESIGGLPDNILTTCLRGPLPQGVLGFLSTVLADNPGYLEMILLNHDTGDETFARLARVVDEKLLGIITENQLRMLREPDIIRGITENPQASSATIDRVVDFAVRSGLNLTDVEIFKEARRRILGIEEAEREPEKEETAEGLLELHAEDLAVEKEEEEEAEEKVSEEDEGKRETLTQKIMRMTVSEKIKMAYRGNKEVRTILMRDANKLVQEAVVQSPRITDGELIGLTNSRTVPDGILKLLLRNRDLMKNYQVKVNLVNNPKTPLPTAMRILPTLTKRDIKTIARSRNVAGALATQARNLADKIKG